MYEIDKKVPIPPPRYEYPWESMEVGDSFAVPVEWFKPKVLHQKLMKSAEKMEGIKVTARYIKDEGIIRCWRIE